MDGVDAEPVDDFGLRPRTAWLRATPFNRTGRRIRSSAVAPPGCLSSPHQALAYHDFDRKRQHEGDRTRTERRRWAARRRPPAGAGSRCRPRCARSRSRGGLGTLTVTGAVLVQQSVFLPSHGHGCGRGGGHCAVRGLGGRILRVLLDNRRPDPGQPSHTDPREPHGRIPPAAARRPGSVGGDGRFPAPVWGYLPILWSPRRRCVFDVLAGTVVTEAAPAARLDPARGPRGSRQRDRAAQRGPVTGIGVEGRRHPNEPRRTRPEPGPTFACSGGAPTWSVTAW